MSLEPPDLQELMVAQVTLVCKDPKETEDNQVSACPVQREIRGTQVTLAYPEVPVTLDYPERMVCPEPSVTQEIKVTVDITAVLEETGPLEHLEQRETRQLCTARLETRDPLETVFPETQAHLDLPDVLDHPEPVETRVRLLL